MSNSTNITNRTREGNGEDFISMEVKITLIVIYQFIILLGVGGNATVCYVVLRYRIMRTVTNFFITNLSASDILVAAVCIPFSVTSNLLIEPYHWPFGAMMCKLVSFAEVLSVLLSSSTLMAISLDRFRAIIYPLRPRLTKIQATMVIGVIWTVSLSISAPLLNVVQLIPVRMPANHGQGSRLYYCQEKWSDSTEVNAKNKYIYGMVLLVLQYVLPLTVLSLTYSRITVEVWGRSAPGECERARDKKRLIGKRKMVKMMITVVLFYCFCWMPLHMINVLIDHNRGLLIEGLTERQIGTLWNFCQALAMSNSCVNPIIYVWMNEKFRLGFKSAYRCLPCVRYDEQSLRAVLLQQQHHTTFSRSGVRRTTQVGDRTPLSGATANSSVRSRSTSSQRQYTYSRGAAVGEGPGSSNNANSIREAAFHCRDRSQSTGTRSRTASQHSRRHPTQQQQQNHYGLGGSGCGTAAATAGAVLPMPTLQVEQISWRRPRSHPGLDDDCGQEEEDNQSELEDGGEQPNCRSTMLNGRSKTGRGEKTKWYNCSSSD